MIQQRRNSPGFGQWVFVTLLIAGVGFVLFQLYEYSLQRNLYPTGLEVASVDIGGLTRAEAEARLTERYIDAPVTLYYEEQPVTILPAEAEFALQFDKLMAAAEEERTGQEFWPGFWGYFWGRPVDVTPIPLVEGYYTINEESLREALMTVARQLDLPADPPRSVGSTMSFEYGAPGYVTNVDASYDDVLAALKRDRDRDAHLVVENIQTDTPNINLLNTLLTNSVQEFESRSGGVASLFVVDLQEGDEISYRADIPVSGMSVLRIPLLVEAVRVLDEQPLPAQMALLRQAATDSDGSTADQMLLVLAGEEDIEKGTALFNEGMQRLGLKNTYISCAFSAEETDTCEPIPTPSNSIENSAIAPDPFRQTTAEDIGVLLSMLYHCAKLNGGALRAIYPDDMSSVKCQTVINLLSENQIGSLIEEGVPRDEALVAHRHGWQTDAYGDGGIVYSSGGDYVMVQFMHKPGWLAWEVSSPLMADLSRATYNFFNFDNQFLGQ